MMNTQIVKNSLYFRHLSKIVLFLALFLTGCYTSDSYVATSYGYNNYSGSSVGVSVGNYPVAPAIYYSGYSAYYRPYYGRYPYNRPYHNQHYRPRPPQHGGHHHRPPQHGSHRPPQYGHRPQRPQNGHQNRPPRRVR